MIKIFFRSLLLLFLLPSFSFSQWLRTSGPEGGDALELHSSDSTVFTSAIGCGLFASENSGDSWNSIYNGMSTSYVNGMVEDSGKLFISTNKGVFMSNDDGNSWVAMNYGLPSGISVRCIAKLGSLLLISTNQGFFISFDNANTWVPRTASFGSDRMGVVGTEILFALESPWNCYRSLDTGSTWISSNAGLPGKIFKFEILGSEIFATGPNGIFHSTDSGKVWNTSFSYANGAGGIKKFGTKLFAGLRSAGVYISDDNGVTWNSSGLSPNTITDFEIKDSLIFASTSINGIYVSSDSGATWIQKNNGYVATNVLSLTFNSDYIFCGTNFTGIFRSADNGITWSRVYSGFGSWYENHQFFGMAAYGSKVFATTDIKVLFSPDNGTTWQYTDTTSSINDPKSVVYDGNEVFVCSRDGLHWSTNDGTTWNKINISAANPRVSNVLTLGDVYVVATDDGIYKSTDAGSTWFSSNTGLVDSFTYRLGGDSSAIFAANPTGLFISTDSAVTWALVDTFHAVTGISKNGMNVIICTYNDTMFFSYDNGSTWATFNDNLPPVQATCVMIKDNQIFAGTNSRGVFVNYNIPNAINEHTTIESRINIFPNPTKGEINFSGIEKASTVRVFDLSGKVVFNTEVNADNSRFSIGHLAKGFYICKFNNENVRETSGKIILN